jgi:hypothetical protein
MFFMLSESCRDEILQVFASVAISRFKRAPKIEEELGSNEGAFESAALTFGKPLILPLAVDSTLPSAVPSVVPSVVPSALPSVVPSAVRIATSYPIAKASDLYHVADDKEVYRIYKEIDDGLFISNKKSNNWSVSGSYHYMNWDVKKVVMTVRQFKTATSLQIDHALPTMSRYRVTAILRELRKQGILIVN